MSRSHCTVVAAKRYNTDHALGAFDPVVDPLTWPTWPTTRLTRTFELVYIHTYADVVHLPDSGGDSFLLFLGVTLSSPDRHPTRTGEHPTVLGGEQEAKVGMRC